MNGIMEKKIEEIISYFVAFTKDVSIEPKTFCIY